MSGYPDDIRRYDSHPGSPFYREPEWSPGCGFDGPGADDFRKASDELEGLCLLLSDAWDRLAQDASEDDAAALVALRDDIGAAMRRHLPLLREVADNEHSRAALEWLIREKA
jgi:hypothetical protein